jgi:hypothetical protein
MAAALGIAAIAQDFAWLGAGAVGTGCLLAFEQAVVLFIPLPAAGVAYAATLFIYTVVGPRRPAKPGPESRQRLLLVWGCYLIVTL